LTLDYQALDEYGRAAAAAVDVDFGPRHSTIA
jgi:hypothetical protein